MRWSAGPPLRTLWWSGRPLVQVAHPVRPKLEGHMAQDMNKIMDKLNDLIALDIDAVNAYDAAIKRMSVPFLQELLGSFQQDHERHIRDLSDCVTRFGGKPRSRPDIKGFVLEGFTAVTSMMGDEAALRAMQGNEQLTTRTYKNALDETWPTDVRSIIEGNYADEKRHLAFIEECLRNRAWETAAQPSQP
jgi:uncharacterized protein (TIGR02284 family)